MAEFMRPTGNAFERTLHVSSGNYPLDRLIESAMSDPDIAVPEDIAAAWSRVRELMAVRDGLDRPETVRDSLVDEVIAGDVEPTSKAAISHLQKARDWEDIDHLMFSAIRGAIHAYTVVARAGAHAMLRAFAEGKVSGILRRFEALAEKTTDSDTVASLVGEGRFEDAKELEFLSRDDTWSTLIALEDTRRAVRGHDPNQWPAITNGRSFKDLGSAFGVLKALRAGAKFLDPGRDERWPLADEAGLVDEETYAEEVTGFGKTYAALTVYGVPRR